MPIRIYDLMESSRDVTGTSGKQNDSFRITKLALEVLNIWTSLACHHSSPKKVIHRPD
jgi:hypothetical protein